MRLLESALRWVVAAGDVAVRRKRGAVIRTFPDFDDQGREIARALRTAGVTPVTWLTRGDGPVPSSVTDLGVDVRRARSASGIAAYWRARTVFHTHGLYEIPPRSRAKVFVNLWHGMPVKRLDAAPAVARRQSDLLTVTSPIHAEHIGRDWNLPPERLPVTGLPRNDALVRAAHEPRGAALAFTGGRPLVLWLPTYRASVRGQLRADGRDFGNDYQLPGATHEDVDRLGRALGVHVLVKPHPMADVGPKPDLENVTVWDEADLTANGLTLYELMGRADLLVTDHSSVWIDYLLLDRPVVFTIADLEEYAASRGHCFTPLADWLPGPVVGDLTSLRTALAEAREDPDGHWAARRAEAVALHHRHRDGASSERVVELVLGG